MNNIHERKDIGVKEIKLKSREEPCEVKVSCTVLKERLEG
jgi:hypothetical protein